MIKRNLKLAFTIISSLLIVVSCSKESAGTNERGSVSFDCSTSSAVNQTTRSESLYNIPEDLIPSTDEVILKVTGSYIDAETSEETPYSYGPLKLTDYKESQPMMIASDGYHAEFTLGEEGKEGETTPYFGGAIYFEVIARGKTREEVSISLQNSIICVEFDDIFENYYSEAEFTITTGSGNSFDFTTSTTDKIVFVEAATTLTLSGSATKSRDGSLVTFNSAEIGTTTAQTLSRINIKANSIGGSSLNITVDDTITEMEETQIELNPQGN